MFFHFYVLYVFPLPQGWWAGGPATSRAWSTHSHVPAGHLSQRWCHLCELHKYNRAASSAHPHLCSQDHRIPRQSWTRQKAQLACAYDSFPRLSSFIKDLHLTRRASSNPQCVGDAGLSSRMPLGTARVPAAPSSQPRAGASHHLFLSLPLCVCSVRQKQYQFAAQ